MGSIAHCMAVARARHADTRSPHRLVVRTSRCGRDNPGSTPGVDILFSKVSNVGNCCATHRRAPACVGTQASPHDKHPQCTILGTSLDSQRRNAKETSRGFEPRSLDSESRVLTVTPRGHMPPRWLRRVTAAFSRCGCELDTTRAHRGECNPARAAVSGWLKT